MPLGASITDGLLSTDGNGYRKPLRDMLVHDGFTVDMVGSRQSGNMTDNDNEGWSGYRIAEVQGKAELSVPGLQPNVFTINAGTNDCVQDYHVDTAGERMAEMIEYLWAASPGSTVILSTLLINLNEDTEKRVQDLNRQYRRLAWRFAAQGKRIVLAEMHGARGPQRSDMADETHPDDGGYLKMAKIWHSSIRIAQYRGFLQPPN